MVEPLQSPLQEANAVTNAMSAAATELRLRQEHAQFLMRELAHRAKNQLAVVRGMAQQTARQSVSVEQFVTQFSQRIQGLAESQDLMLRQNWQGAWLADLVRAHLDLFGAVARAHIKGPELFLSADAVQNIGFALHELATNASKHGAIVCAGRQHRGELGMARMPTGASISIGRSVAGLRSRHPRATVLGIWLSPSWSRRGCKAMRSSISSLTACTGVSTFRRVL